MSAKLKIADLAAAAAGVLFLLSSLIHQFGGSYSAYHLLVLNVLVGTYLLGLVVAGVSIAVTLGLLPDRFPWRHWAAAVATVVLLDAVVGAIALSQLIKDLSMLAPTRDVGLGAGTYLGVAAAVVLFVSVALRSAVALLERPVPRRSRQRGTPQGGDQAQERSAGDPYPGVTFGPSKSPVPTLSPFAAPSRAGRTEVGTQPHGNDPTAAHATAADPTAADSNSWAPTETGATATRPDETAPAVTGPDETDVMGLDPGRDGPDETAVTGGGPDGTSRLATSVPGGRSPGGAVRIATGPPTSAASSSSAASFLLPPVPAPTMEETPFSTFWAAVPTSRPIYSPQDPSVVLATLYPGTWYAAVAPHAHGLVIQLSTGDTGVLVDVADLFRG